MWARRARYDVSMLVTDVAIGGHAQSDRQQCCVAAGRLQLPSMWLLVCSICMRSAELRIWTW